MNKSGYDDHPEDLRWALKACSILDTIMAASETETRYHRYVANRFPNVDVGIVDHGNGNILYCILGPLGAVIKGFDHESAMSPHVGEGTETWPGMFNETPRELLPYLDDPEFNKADTTFCIWRRKTDKHWWQGEIKEPEHGEWSSNLIKNIFTTPGAYVAWAADHYKKSLPVTAVKKVYDSCSVDRETALKINDKVNLEMLERELKAMGSELM